jgi:hypothetical protein
LLNELLDIFYEMVNVYTNYSPIRRSKAIHSLRFEDIRPEEWTGIFEDIRPEEWAGTPRREQTLFFIIVIENISIFAFG